MVKVFNYLYEFFITLIKYIYIYIFKTRLNPQTKFASLTNLYYKRLEGHLDTSMVSYQNGTFQCHTFIQGACQSACRPGRELNACYPFTIWLILIHTHTHTHNLTHTHSGGSNCRIVAPACKTGLKTCENIF